MKSTTTVRTAPSASSTSMISIAIFARFHSTWRGGKRVAFLRVLVPGIASDAWVFSVMSVSH